MKIVYIYMFEDGTVQMSSALRELKPRLAPMHGAQRVFLVREGCVVVMKDRLGIYFAGQQIDEIPPVVLPGETG